MISTIVFTSIIVGAIVGYLASLIVKGRGSGILLNIIIGFFGSIIGNWLLIDVFDVFSMGWLWSFISSLIGAIVLLLLASLFNR